MTGKGPREGASRQILHYMEKGSVLAERTISADDDNDLVTEGK